MPKVDYKDLEEITKFLDKLKLVKHLIGPNNYKKSVELSTMIKDKYTEIKPDYESTN